MKILDRRMIARAGVGGGMMAALLGAISATGAAQPASSGASPGIGQQLVDRERAFSRASVEHGMRDAFLQFIAEDGIIFAPGPVAGRQFLAGRPTPPGTLQWAPAYAGASRSGDLGFTTGPYIWESGKERGTGRYLTIWRKQADGSWRFVLDRGIPGPEGSGAAAVPASTAAALAGQSVTWTMAAARGAGRATGLDGDIAAEETQLAEAAAGSAREALAGRLADDAHLLRRGSAPAVNPAAHASLLAGSPPAVRYRMIGNGTSQAGDMAYTYGDAAWDDGARPVHGHFVRVWQRRESGWTIVLDSLVDLPGPVPQS